MDEESRRYRLDHQLRQLIQQESALIQGGEFGYSLVPDPEHVC